MTRRSIVRAFLLLSAVAGSLILLELGVRRFLPRFDPSGHLRLDSPGADRPALGPAGATQRHVKNAGDFDVTVCFNAHGFRDAQDLRSSGPDDYVVVGDSFSFGWGVEEHERCSNILADLMRARVFNIAMPNASLAGYGHLLEYANRLGLRTKRVIVGLCMENDLSIYPGANAPSPRPVATRRAWPVRSWMKSHSAAWFALTHVVHATPALKNAGIRFGLVAPARGGLRREACSPEVMASSLGQLRRVIADCDATVLIIPSRGLWTGDDRDAEARLHEEFAAALRRTGVAVVDMRGPIEADGNPLACHFANDPHWNARGHALAARTLADHLRLSPNAPSPHSPGGRDFPHISHD